MNIFFKPINFLIKKTNAYKDIKKELENIKKSFTIKNSQIKILGSIVLFVPDHLTDYIQREIVCSEDFYEREILAFLDSYLQDSAVIVDAGANIGNHSLYWATQRSAKKIFAFEPVQQTYSKLKKNIELNELSNVIEPLNIALGEHNNHAEILQYHPENIGGTSLKENENGEIIVNKLDFVLDNKITKLDLLKVDVEGFEVQVLKGSRNTISKFKPIILVECFGEKRKTVKLLMKSYGYKLENKLIDGNYLYLPNEYCK